MVDLNEFPSIFQKVQHSHSRHQKTTSNLLRINLKCILKCNEIWPLEGAMYITLWYRIFGGIPKMLVLYNFLRKLMVSDKKIHRAFRTRTCQIYKQNPLENFFIFTIYQNYTLVLIMVYIIILCSFSFMKTQKLYFTPISHYQNRQCGFSHLSMNSSCGRQKGPSMMTRHARSYSLQKGPSLEDSVE